MIPENQIFSQADYKTVVNVLEVAKHSLCECKIKITSEHGPTKVTLYNDGRVKVKGPGFLYHFKNYTQFVTECIP